MNEKTLLPGNRNYSHKFRTMPIKHPRCGRFVTLITYEICYPLNIKYNIRHIENFHQELHIGIVFLYLPENTDVLKEQYTSWIIEIQLLSCKTESLARRTTNQQVNVWKFRDINPDNTAQLDSFREIMLGLSDGCLVDFGCEILLDLDTGLP